jgi:hypothetical protein
MAWRTSGHGQAAPVQEFEVDPVVAFLAQCTASQPRSVHFAKWARGLGSLREINRPIILVNLAQAGRNRPDLATFQSPQPPPAATGPQLLLTTDY